MRSLILTLLVVLGGCATDLEGAGGADGTTYVYVQADGAVTSVDGDLVARCGPCALHSDCQAGLYCDFTAGGICKAEGESGKVCNEDCASDPMWCGEGGRCTLSNGKCVATSRADCLAADHCQKFGHCTPIDGACLAANDADCAMSLYCKQAGKNCASNGGGGCIDG